MCFSRDVENFSEKSARFGDAVYRRNGVGLDYGILRIELCARVGRCSVDTRTFFTECLPRSTVFRVFVDCVACLKAGMYVSAAVRGTQSIGHPALLRWCCAIRERMLTESARPPHITLFFCSAPQTPGTNYDVFLRLRSAPSLSSGRPHCYPVILK